MNQSDCALNYRLLLESMLKITSIILINAFNDGSKLSDPDSLMISCAWS